MLEQGAQIGHYKIVGLLAAGALAQTYLAEHDLTRRRVIVKVLHEMSSPRLAKEIVVFAQLEHPNIARLYDVGFFVDSQTGCQTAYLAMEYVDGPLLASRLAMGPKHSLQEALGIVSDLCRGLHYAHLKGVFHGDLKPENVRLGPDGSARITGLEEAALLRMGLRHGALQGTAPYMAPEVIRGARQGPKDDIWVLGVMLYELIVGRHPFDTGDSVYPLLLRITTEQPPPPSSLVPGVPSAVDAIVMRALQKSPSERYQSCAEMLADLEAVRSQESIPSRPIAAQSQAETPQRVETARRVFVSHVAKDASIALALAQGLESAGYTTWYYERDAIPGPTYLAQVDAAIELAQAIVVLISPDSIRSQQTTNEVFRAYEAGKPFMPILHGMSHAEFQQRQPEWRLALGAATSIVIPRTGVAAILPPVIAGLRALGVEPRLRPTVPEPPHALETPTCDERDAPALRDEGLRQKCIRADAAFDEKPDAVLSGVPPRGSTFSRDWREISRWPLQSWLRFIPTSLAAALAVVGILAGVHFLLRARGQERALPEKALLAPDGGNEVGLEWRCPTDGKIMVWVRPGWFVMGADGDVSAQEKPAHEVWVDGFWIDKTEVTQAEYARFVEATGRPAPEYWDADSDPSLPVVMVTWDDAVAYARWASKRLPTEAEWEKAARGNDGRIYPWGSVFDPARVNCDLSGERSKQPERWADFLGTAYGWTAGASPYGALNMAGNVYEWCSDWYDPSYYQHGPERNPTGPVDGDERVRRGGSWSSLPRYVRCSCGFRAKVTTDSDPKCARIPIQSAR